MPTWRTIALATLVFCSTLHSYESHAQETTIGPVVPVADTISQLKAALIAAIREGEASGTTLGFQMASQAKTLLAQLEAAATRFEGKLFRDLTAVEQRTFTDLLFAVDKFDAAVARNLGDAAEIVDSMGAHIAGVTGGGPSVRSASPTMVLGGVSNVEISVKGSFPNVVGAAVVIGGFACRERSRTAILLRVSCPDEAFRNKKGWLTGALKLTQEKTTWFFFKERSDSSIPISIRIIDPELGRYEFTADIKDEESIGRWRKVAQTERNGHCEPANPTVWTFEPAAGCRIDVTHVHRAYATDGDTTCGRVENLTEGGFTVSCTIRNRGQCEYVELPVLGRRRTRDDRRGRAWVEAKWFEVCAQTSKSSLPSTSGTVFWNEYVDIPIPENTTSWTLRITQADGRVIIVHESTRERWLEVQNQLHHVSIRPKQLDDAFAP